MCREAEGGRAHSSGAQWEDSEVGRGAAAGCVTEFLCAVKLTLKQVQLIPNEHFYNTRKHNTDRVSSTSFDFHFCICVGD